MNEVCAIVEGQTEQSFVKEILAPHLGVLGIVIWPRLPGKMSGSGGVKRWESARTDIIRSLKERDDRICTTMFDYYGMPMDWPGRAESRSLPPETSANHIELSLLEDISGRMGEGFRRERFVPHVQLHEYESLLYSSTTTLGELLSETPGTINRNVARQLALIVQNAGSPEAINDDPNTAPSKRILALAPGYRKPLHGVIAAQRIGLPTIRSQCPHFNNWVSKLESLA